MNVAKKNQQIRVGLAALAALAVIAAASAWARPAAQASADHSADDAALRKLVATMSQGWNTHDSQLMVTALDENVEWFSWNGGILNGRKAVEKQHHDLFEDTYKNVRRTDTVKFIRYLGPDLASVDNYWTMTGAKYRDGSPWPYRAGYVNLLVARRDGRWTVIQSHTADFNAKAPSGSASN